MKNGKRILKVTIKRMQDSDPDTSWLGEYSDRTKTDYAIERKHSIDCQINKPVTEGLGVLSRVMHYLTAVTYAPCPFSEDGIWHDVSDGRGLVVGKEDELQECGCGERGDIERNEYRYFNGNVENYKGETSEKIREYILRDYERMERLQHGDWCFVGVRAEAEVSLTGDVVQEVSSGGLWGIESDSDADYFSGIEKDELSELRKQLLAVGFSSRAISNSFKEVVQEVR